MQFSISATASSFYLEINCFDLIFLDVELSGINGLKPAKELRQRDVYCQLIFLSAHKEYVFDTFDVIPANYILKPIHGNKLFAELSRLIQKIESINHRCVFLKTASSFYKVRLSNILYVEVIDRKGPYRRPNF